MSVRSATIWIPSILGTVSLVLGWLLPRFLDSLPTWTTTVGIFVAVLLWIFAIWLAYRIPQNDQLKGGAGGRAAAQGINNNATGGRGGDAGSGNGGDGGSATVKGRGSTAKGGAGGNG